MISFGWRFVFACIAAEAVVIVFCTIAARVR
jgi:predicted MFS family arabinose efflux permease